MKAPRALLEREGRGCGVGGLTDEGGDTARVQSRCRT